MWKGGQIPETQKDSKAFRLKMRNAGAGNSMHVNGYMEILILEYMKPGRWVCSLP